MVLTVTSASNEELVTRRCEDEPIRAPGSIQRYGALLGLKYGEHKHLQVRVASENCRKVLGYGPEQLFELPSFLDVLKVETRQEVIAHINQLVRAGDEMKEETQLDVFRIVIAFPFEPEIMLWCAMHLAPGGDGLVICELEEYSDSFYFKDVDSAKTLPVISPPPMGVDVSAEEFKKSTTSTSQPLPVLAVARKGGSEHFSSMDIFKAMTQAQKQIAACTSLSTLFDVVVGVVAELTCFHRVMFYRFDSAMNGCVESELVNPQASTDIFRGQLIRIVMFWMSLLTTE
jgi:light-regulated signal transduction histidine kinase (bacteriophytochrome)